MSAVLEQEVREVQPNVTPQSEDRAGKTRRVVAGPAGLALLLAGGGLLIRVTLLALYENDMTGRGWLFTAIACLLAGVALVLIALPRVVHTAHDGDPAPPSESPAP